MLAIDFRVNIGNFIADFFNLFPLITSKKLYTLNQIIKILSNFECRNLLPYFTLSSTQGFRIPFSYIFIFLLCFAGSYFPIEATVSDRGFHPITLSHGLSDLLINHIYKDREGYVWFGTESSVDRFDGNHIIRFPLEGEKHSSRRVNAITEAGDIIFVGANQGLYEINLKNKEIRKIFPDKIDFSVNDLYLSKEGNLYIATSKGLYIFNRKDNILSHHLLNNDNFSSENDIKGVWLQEDDSNLWLLTRERLWRLTLPYYKSTFYQIPLVRPSTVMCADNRNIYIGTDGDGIIPFDIEALKFGSVIKVGNGVITSLNLYKDEITAATDGDGVFIYSLKNRKVEDHFTTGATSRQRLRTNSVYSALKDKDGILWVGYYQGGVDYSPYHSYSPEVYASSRIPDLKEMTVRALKKGGGFTAIGTHDGLLLIEDGTGEVRNIRQPKIDSNLIFSIEYWKDKFYIGTYHGGMYAIDPHTGKVERFGPKGNDNLTIFQLRKSDDDNLWAATSEGVYKFDNPNGNPTGVFTSATSQLPQGNVYEIFFDSLGRGWFCTENGIAILRDGQLTTSGFPTGFPIKGKIRAVYEDSHHNLFFLPDRGEIWQTDLGLNNISQLQIGATGRFSQFTSIIEDPDGRIWLGTDKGLVAIKPDDPQEYLLFNNAGGVLNPIYTLAIPYLQGEEIGMGSTSGLHIVDLAKVRESMEEDKRHRLVVTDINDFNSHREGFTRTGENSYEVTLGKNDRELSVNLSDLSFVNPDFYELEYKMGDEPGWHGTTGSNPIVYHDLESGVYHLRVREAGNPNSEITITVKKPYAYGSAGWWIAGGVLLALLIFIPLYFILKTKKKKDIYVQETTKPNPEKEIATEEKISYRTTRLSEEECRRILKILDKVMKEERPFINPDLKSRDLAEMAGTTTHSLSFLFNQYLEKSYYDYVNEYRVEEFKRLVKEGESSKYTLTTMAEMCGFSSRASFFRHFKSLTGITPAEFIKSLS